MVDTTVWDTVGTTDTDTTTARGLLMPNLKPKPHPRPMLKPLLTMVDTTVMVDTALDTDTVDTMVVDTVMVDTAVDTHTVMANRNCFRLEYLAIFFNNPPLELSKPTLLPSAILLKLCFFMKKLLQNSYLDPIVIKNNQKMPLSKKGTYASSSVLLSGYDIQLPIRDCDTI